MTDGAAGCVRCARSEDEHLLQDRDEADEIQQRIWKALGHPCPEFTLTPAVIYAGQQAATSRWGRNRQPPPPAPRAAVRPVTVIPGPDGLHGLHGAALAREALNRALHRKEAS